MDIVQVAIGNIVGLVAFALIVAVAMKTYQIANTLSEVKDQLSGLRRDRNSALSMDAPVIAKHGISGEDMLRAVSAELERQVTSEPAETSALPASTEQL